MRFFSLAVLAMVVSVAAGGGAAAATPMQPSPSTTSQDLKLADSINPFAVELYGQLRQNEGNLFFSPASIATAFAMAYDGARGQTAAQIAKVFHFDESAQRVNAAFGKLLADWTRGAAGKEYQLAVANAMWGQQGYPFSAAFNQSLQLSYGAGLRVVDFRQSEAARREINQWVEQQTNRKIQDLIPQGGVGPDTRLVLANAIYFKADWDRQFAESATRPQDFKLPGGQVIQAPTMHQSGSFRFTSGDELSALEMTYAHNAFSMIVLLPDQADGLPALEQSLSADKLGRWLSAVDAARPREVRVSFPKFKLTREVDLTKVLPGMGMPLAFSSQADYSGMNDGKESLTIGGAFHKAFVDVNEEGTEAAAATAIGIRATAMIRSESFTADHPFLFIIRDNRSGSILFMGRVANPHQ